MQMETPAENVITIFGSNRASDGDLAYQVAHEAGKTVARIGYQVANGGYGGTMEASARGAKSVWGETIGVTCSIWNSKPNRYIDRVVKTSNLLERLETLIELGTSGYVVLPGATGTLAELACVWELISKGLIEHRPLVCVGDFWRPLTEMISQQRPASAKNVAFVETPGELESHFPNLMEG